MLTVKPKNGSWRLTCPLKYLKLRRKEADMNELATHPQGDEKNQSLALISGPVVSMIVEFKGFGSIFDHFGRGEKKKPP